VFRVQIKCASVYVSKVQIIVCISQKIYIETKYDNYNVKIIQLSPHFVLKAVKLQSPEF